MTRHVRVLAVSSPQDDGMPYLFDLAITDENKIQGHNYTFGLHGHFTGAHVYPFYMDGRGNIDFGSHGEAHRMRSTNLHHRLIRVGELFTIKDGHKETSYKIARIDPLHS
jgi:hypothetical protein